MSIEDRKQIQIQQILDNITLFRKQYKVIEPYNLFKVLRSQSDEVRLHSRFLSDLLNPKGLHGLAGFPLSSFLSHITQIMQGSIDLNAEDCFVWNEYKNIDILIRDKSGKKAIIIENKIYAYDQYEQLQRYHETLVKEGFEQIVLCYLTLQGDAPSEESMGSLPKEVIGEIINFSYDYDIRQWLKVVLSEAVAMPSLRESIIQYQNIIANLLGENMNKEYIEVVKNVLLKSDNLSCVEELVQAYEEIKVDVIANLFTGFLKRMQARFGTVNKEIPLKEDIKNYINGRRNYNYLTTGVPLACFEGYYLTLEAGGSALYYGIRGHTEKEQHSMPEIFTIRLPEEKNFKRSNWWPIYAYVTKNTLDLRNLSSQQIVTLANEDQQSVNLTNEKELLDEIEEGLVMIVEYVKKEMKML